ncbi:hypothetical protein [Streptomyces sp. enrichment culture]|uniref:hypothetical protein n=1 Tax=Streptomyces sp. enrichment culture TaxID=1795815 RepID=UPI003F5668F4
MNQVLNGDVVVGEGGRLFVRDPDGTNVFETGQSPVGGDYFTRMRRDTGGLAFTIGSNSFPDDDAPTQMVRMWNRAGNAIVMDDYYADHFLGRPWIPIQLHPTNDRGRYTSSSYGAAWAGWTAVHNAVAVVIAQTYCGDAGAQVRLTLTPQNGTSTTMAEWDCAPNQWTTRQVDYPLDGLKFLDYAYFSLDHRAKAAGQEVETRLLLAHTRNTTAEDEDPDPPVTLAANPTTQEVS